MGPSGGVFLDPFRPNPCERDSMRQETSYVRRGDRERRRAQVRRWRALLTSGAIGAVVLLLGTQVTQGRIAAASTFSFGLPGESRRLREELDATRGELQLAQA